VFWDFNTAPAAQPLVGGFFVFAFPRPLQFPERPRNNSQALPE
jgi:hypothetical protein